MIEKTDLLLQERLSILSPDYRDFVLGDMPSKSVATFSEVLSFNELQKVIFENGYTMYLFLFISRFELIEFLAQECAIAPFEAVTVINNLYFSTPDDIRLSIDTAYREINDDPDIIRRNTALEALYTDKLEKFIDFKLAVTKKAAFTPLSEVDRRKLVEFCGDTFLNIFRAEDFNGFLFHTLGIYDEIQRQGILKMFEEYVSVKEQEIVTQAAYVIPFTPQTTVTNNEIIKTQIESVPLQPVRTMSHDMAEIRPGSDVVYQSSQADILAHYNNTQPEVAPPPAEPPRWETDSAK